MKKIVVAILVSAIALSPFRAVGEELACKVEINADEPAFAFLDGYTSAAACRIMYIDALHCGVGDSVDRCFIVDAVAFEHRPDEDVTMAFPVSGDAVGESDAQLVVVFEIIFVHKAESE